MTSARLPYHPISCEFHDRLEDLATLRKTVRIRFKDASGTDQERDVRISDVFAHDGEEFLLLSTGEHVRLDWLVEVDGARLADFGDSDSCRI